MGCKEIQESLTPYLYEDLSPEERAACDAHLAGCTSCRTALEDARRLHELLRQRPILEPTPGLLVQCRQALDEAVDQEELGWRGLIPVWLSDFASIPATRAVSALTLVLLGIGLGWTLRNRALSIGSGSQGVVSSSFMGSDMQNLRIRDISRVAPDPQTGEVHITLDAERHVTLRGSLEDPRIQQVLVYAVRNYDNPGIRRDTLDALRVRRNDPNIREAMLYALRRDPNVGVRLEALRSVQAMEWSPYVRQALLDTVKHDLNSGVRVAAINALTKHADKEALPALEQLAASDPDRSVRFKCASAVRELAGDRY